MMTTVQHPKAEPPLEPHAAVSRLKRQLGEPNVVPDVTVRLAGRVGRRQLRTLLKRMDGLVCRGFGLGEDNPRTRLTAVDIPRVPHPAWLRRRTGYRVIIEITTRESGWDRFLYDTGTEALTRIRIYPRCPELRALLLDPRCGWTPLTED